MGIALHLCLYNVGLRVVVFVVFWCCFVVVYLVFVGCFFCLGSPPHLIIAKV